MPQVILNYSILFYMELPSIILCYFKLYIINVIYVIVTELVTIVHYTYNIHTFKLILA